MSEMKTASPNLFSMFLVLLAALGVPISGGLALFNQALAHPWIAILSLIVYELILGFVTLASKIWKRHENDILDRLETYLVCFFSRYRKRYLKHLIYRHRDFDVKGLRTQGVYSLELQRVFVDLSVSPQPPHSISQNPLHVPSSAIHHGQHSLWKIMKLWKDSDRHLAIIGPPGAGKTTLLKHVALTMASGLKHRRIYKAENRIPILLYLRQLEKWILEQPDLQLSQLISKTLAAVGPNPPMGWFNRQLRAGRCLVMLDGLDEVSDAANRKLIVDWIEGQMSAFPLNRFLVTSRPNGYLYNPIAKVTVLQVQSFTIHQIKCFIENWYHANEIMSARKDDPGVRMKSDEGAQDLLSRIFKNPTLFSLSINPLLLTMIATVHRFRSSLPGRRVDLYAEICDVFLGGRQESKGILSTLRPAQKQKILEKLAFWMMKKNTLEIQLEDAEELIKESLQRYSQEITPKSFFKDIAECSGLLLEKEKDILGFAHKTFQEYLASKYILGNDIEHEIYIRVKDPWWHETIQLYCAQTDATQIISRCIEGEEPSAITLVLASQCANEAFEISPKMKRKFIEYLKRGLDDANHDRRRVILEATLAINLRNMHPIAEEKDISSHLISNAEYQLFVDEMQSIGGFFQPIHWRGNRFPHGKGHLPIVGLTTHDATVFCKWLTDREQSNWKYRLPNPREVSSQLENKWPDRESDLQIGHWIFDDESFDFHWIRSDDKHAQTSHLLHSSLRSDRERSCPSQFARALVFQLTICFRSASTDSARRITPLLNSAIQLATDFDSKKDNIDTLRNGIEILNGIVKACVDDPDDDELFYARSATIDLISSLMHSLSKTKINIHDFAESFEYCVDVAEFLCILEKILHDFHKTYKSNDKLTDLELISNYAIDLENLQVLYFYALFSFSILESFQSYALEVYDTVSGRRSYLDSPLVLSFSEFRTNPNISHSFKEAFSSFLNSNPEVEKAIKCKFQSIYMETENLPEEEHTFPEDNILHSILTEFQSIASSLKKEDISSKRGAALLECLQRVNSIDTSRVSLFTLFFRKMPYDLNPWKKIVKGPLLSSSHLGTMRFGITLALTKQTSYITYILNYMRDRTFVQHVDTAVRNSMRESFKSESICSSAWRWFHRYRRLQIVASLDLSDEENTSLKNWSEHEGIMTDISRESTSPLSDYCRTVNQQYFELALIENRIDGKTAAVEALRIVRELDRDD